MRVVCMIGVLAWAICVAAGESKGAGKAATSPESGPLKKGAKLVVIQDKAPLMYGDAVIGELMEGTRLEFKEEREDANKVKFTLGRVTCGANWFEGWVRSAMVAPDSVADVNVKVLAAAQRYVYENQTLPGSQFIEVKVKYEATEKSPPRLYLGFADDATADLYLSYGRDHKALPYGFWVRSARSAKIRKFETREKQQILDLKPGEPAQEIYVFVVPLSAKERDLELVVKDKAFKLDMKGR